jgi:hypothetical protein
VILLSACGSDGGDEIAVGKASKLVLRESDLRGPFQAFYVGPLARLDTSGTARADPQRYGRKGGWIARFNRPGSAATSGPLVVESRVDLFGGAGGAKSDLAAYRRVFVAVIGRSGGAARLVDAPPLGDEAVAMTTLQRGLHDIRFYTVAWRDRNSTASLAVNGFDGRVTLADAVALARRQEQRIRNG